MKSAPSFPRLSALVALILVMVLGTAVTTAWATFSIIGRDERGMVGVAIASLATSTGMLANVVPGKGAMVVQGSGHIKYLLTGSELLGKGMTAEAVVRSLCAENDPVMVKYRPGMQFAVIGPSGAASNFTGDAIKSARGFIQGDLAGEDWAVQGNVLGREAVLPAMRDSWLNSREPLGARLLGALAQGRYAGGDARGERSAALLFTQAEGPPVVLRVDDHPDPIGELRRLWNRWLELGALKKSSTLVNGYLAVSGNWEINRLVFFGVSTDPLGSKLIGLIKYVDKFRKELLIDKWNFRKPNWFESVLMKLAAWFNSGRIREYTESQTKKSFLNYITKQLTTTHGLKLASTRVDKYNWLLFFSYANNSISQHYKEANHKIIDLMQKVNITRPYRSLHGILSLNKEVIRILTDGHNHWRSCILLGGNSAAKGFVDYCFPNIVLQDVSQIDKKLFGVIKGVTFGRFVPNINGFKRVANEKTILGLADFLKPIVDIAVYVNSSENFKDVVRSLSDFYQEKAIMAKKIYGGTPVTEAKFIVSRDSMGEPQRVVLIWDKVLLNDSNKLKDGVQVIFLVL